MPQQVSNGRSVVQVQPDPSLAWFAPGIVVGLAVPASIASSLAGLHDLELYWTSLTVLSPLAIAILAMAPTHVRKQHDKLFCLALLALLGNIVWIGLGIGAYFTTGGGPVWRLVHFARSWNL